MTHAELDQIAARARKGLRGYVLVPYAEIDDLLVLAREGLAAREQASADVKLSQPSVTNPICTDPIPDTLNGYFCLTCGWATHMHNAQPNPPTSGPDGVR